MKDKLSLSTEQNQDGSFTTHWQWCQSFVAGKQPSKGGIVTLALNEKWVTDRKILAELAAIHHLLCVEEVHGKGRMGTNIEIEVSFGAIRKALVKGAIKDTDRGDTDKQHVALFSKFLATKFFEAVISVASHSKKTAIEPKVTTHYTIEIANVPSVHIQSPIGSVVISRHALNRVVGRVIAKDIAPNEDDLMSVPDLKWTKAWRFLEKVLHKSIEIEIPRQERNRIVRKYGSGIVALHHYDAQVVFILKQHSYGAEMITMLLDNEYNRITPPRGIPRQMGQRLVFENRA